MADLPYEGKPDDGEEDLRNKFLDFEGDARAEWDQLMNELEDGIESYLFDGGL